METKYSSTPFEGCTHRFKLFLYSYMPNPDVVTIYSNNDSMIDLEEFIKQNKTEKLVDFKIYERISMVNKAIHEYIKDI